MVARWRLFTAPGPAWVILSLALALHVADEAVNDFLSVYNPAVLAIRERLPFLPLPTFTFSGWLAGVTGAVITLLALSPFAFSRATWMKPLAFVFSAFMVVNAGAHLVLSLALGRIVPGTYSAPVLLAAAVTLLVSVFRDWRPAREPF